MLQEVEEDLAALKAEVREKEAIRDPLKAADDEAVKEAAAAKVTREAAEVELAALLKERAAKERKAAALRALIKANT